MHKREFFLFLSFVALFILFAIFQNFSFPTGQLEQLSKKEFYENKIRKFVPTYSFNNYIGETIEAPYGYVEEIANKIANKDKRIVFDQNRFIKNEIGYLPGYKEIKKFIEFGSDDSSDRCVQNPAEPRNNCYTEYSTSSGSQRNSGTMKLKTNPLRQTASLSVPGAIQSEMVYVGDKRSVNVQLKKDLNSDSDVKLELDSQGQGTLKFDVRW